MCQRVNCNPIRHLLGQCDHAKKVEALQKKIVVTRKATVKEVKQFNRELSLLIKDDDIHLTLSNIKKAAE